jgi:bifunctional non-homologous end joining protein LigD
MPAKQEVHVEGRRLALTNLDKVLYRGGGFTKAQVIDYYTRVSKWLLPHFSGRAVTMQRFPDGVRGKMFYEKDAPKFTPPWVHTTQVARQAGGTPIRYVCIDDLPTLVWCANLASLELHTFLHRATHLDAPTSIVFDLDPGEGINLLGCAEVATLLRALLQQVGLECFPKVSGSKGLQLYVPLNTPVTYAETRAFAQSVAQILEKTHPKLIVSEMAKEVRRQRVFIDWSQNSDFKTTVGVYSLRAKSDVPFVSAPVSWAEVEALLKKRDPEALRFEPAPLLERLEKTGDLFSAFLTLKQDLSNLGGTKSSSARRQPVKEVEGKHNTIDHVEPSKTGTSALKFVEPMLLLKTDRLPEGKDWLYEIKLDGYRALALKSNGRVDLRSRNNKDFSRRYAHIARALQAMPDETLVDGEIVALDQTGRPSFNLLQNNGPSRAPVVYYVFDVLVLRGKNIMAEPVIKRREVLQENLLVELSEPIRFSPELEARLSDLINSVKAQEFEGLVAKRRNSTYEPGQRSGAWQKMRVSLGQEFVIGGYTPSGKNFDALVIGYYDQGSLIYAARTRNGFTPSLRENVFEKLRRYEIEECPFSNLPEKSSGRWGQGLTAAKMKECRWLKPVTVGQFEFVEWTPENHLRHCKFVVLREDKKATDVVRERP